MSDRLDACELLNVARQTLLEKLLPVLPADLRYETLMIANAMAIARRECQLAAQAEHAEMDALQCLSISQADEPSRGLETARRQLAGAIREGHYDTPGPGQDELLSALERVTLGQLAISNPKVLGHER
jgi:hypothetical protein